jgi:hypothetical protein
MPLYPPASGGGAGTLQDAYDGGNVIQIDGSRPFEIDDPNGNSLIYIAGDGSQVSINAADGAATLVGGQLLFVGGSGGPANGSAVGGTGGQMVIAGGIGGQASSSFAAGAGGIGNYYGGRGGDGTATRAAGAGATCFVGGGDAGTNNGGGGNNGGALVLDGGLGTGAGTSGAVLIGTGTASGVTIARAGTTTTFTSGLLASSVANGGSAIAFKLTSVALSTSGAKLLSLYNNTTEELYVSKDGDVFIQGSFKGNNVDSFAGGSLSVGTSSGNVFLGSSGSNVVYFNVLATLANGVRFNASSKTSNGNLGNSDYFTLVNATGLTLNLPSASGVAGQHIIFRDVTGNANPNLTVGSLGGTVDGSASLTNAVGKNGTIGFVSDGTNWYSTYAIAKSVYNISASIGTAQTAAVTLQNITAATSGAGNQQWSPGIQLTGQQWNGSASNAVDWMIQHRPVSGRSSSTDSGDLVFLNRVNGGSWNERISIREGLGVTSAALYFGTSGQEYIFGNGGQLFLRAGGGNGQIVLSATAFESQVDIGQTLGSATHRWTTVYATGLNSLASTMTFTSGVTASGSAIAYISDTTNALIAGDLHTVWRSGGTEFARLKPNTSGSGGFILSYSAVAAAPVLYMDTSSSVGRVHLRWNATDGILMNYYTASEIDFTVAGSSRVMMSSTAIYPSTDNQITNGKSSNRYTQSWSIQYGRAISAPTVAATTTCNPVNGEVFRVLLSATTITTMVISAGLAGQIVQTEMIQDATGSRAVPAAGNWTNCVFAGGTAPTWSTGSNKRDVITWMYDSTDAKWYEIARSLNM